MQKDLKDELQFLLFEFRTIKNTYLQMLKDLSFPEDWTAAVQQLLALPLPSYQRFIILNFEQCYRQLLEEIIVRMDFIAFERYEESLRSWSPEKTCKCYVDFLKNEMHTASNRKQYWSVIQHLKNLLKYQNGKQVVSEIVQYWRTQHNNRPAMMYIPLLSAKTKQPCNLCKYRVTGLLLELLDSVKDQRSPRKNLERRISII